MNDIPSPDRSRAFSAALAAITFLASLVRLWGLPGQPLLADDVAAGVSAIDFVERGQISTLMWHHPRLRDLLVYASTAVAGQTKLGLALPSLLAGVLSVPVLGLLARRVAGPAAGLLAAGLVAVDALHVHYSRQAAHDVYMFLFGAMGVLLALEHARTGRRGLLVGAGVAFGLGVASKWAVLAPTVVTAAWLCARILRERGGSRAATAARIAFVVAALGVLPLAVYLATWAPWFARGRDLIDWLALHRTLAAEARVHVGFNPYDLELPHRAWLWFAIPAWYADFTFGRDGPVALIAVANPLVWLAVLPAVAFVAHRAWRTGAGECALVAAAFVGTWLPFAFAPRPIWLHSALAVLPFALVAVSALAVHLAGSGPRARLRLGAYAALVVISSVPFLLLATGGATEVGALRGLVERFRPDARFEGGGAAAP